MHANDITAGNKAVVIESVSSAAITMILRIVKSKKNRSDSEYGL